MSAPFPTAPRVPTTQTNYCQTLRHNSAIVAGFHDNAQEKKLDHINKKLSLKTNFYYFLLVQKPAPISALESFMAGNCFCLFIESVTRRPTKSQASHCLFVCKWVPMNPEMLYVVAPVHAMCCYSKWPRELSIFGQFCTSTNHTLFWSFRLRQTHYYAIPRLAETIGTVFRVFFVVLTHQQFIILSETSCFSGSFLGNLPKIKKKNCCTFAFIIWRQNVCFSEGLLLICRSIFVNAQYLRQS